MVVRVTIQAAFGHVMSDPMVEAGHEDEITTASYPDGVAAWTDITQWVALGETQGINITRGAGDELSETQPGTCALALDDQDGYFTPGNGSSPFSPHVLKQTPLRVITTTLAGKNFVQTPSFEGSSVRGWYRGNPDSGASYILDATHVQHGSAAMRINWVNSGDGGKICTELFGLTIGHTYTASAYVYVETGEPPVRLGIAGGATGTASATLNAFERITVTFTATAAAHTLQVTPTGPGALGPGTWLDAVQVEEGSSATAFDSAGAGVHPRGLWMVNEWPLQWEGLEAKTAISCTDVFKTLSRDDELQPMLVEEVLLREPAAYYPLSESSDSVTAGDLAGLGAGALSLTQAGAGGTVTFGDDGGPEDTLSVPTFTPVSDTAGLYLTGDMGTALASQAVSNGLWIEAWFETSTDGRVIVGAESPDHAHQVIISLESGTGKLRIQTTSTGFSNLESSVANTADLADGDLHHLVWDQDGGDVYIDGNNAFAVTTAAGVYDLQLIAIGGWRDNRLWSGQIAHVALYAPATAAPGWFTDHYEVGTTEMLGEPADERASRIASYAGAEVEAVGATFDPLAPQTGLGSTALSHLREIEATEGGKLIASRGTAALLLQSRDVRYNPTPVASLEYADCDTNSLVAADDDQKLLNIYEATRPGGADVRVIDADSIHRYGRYRNQGGGTLYKTTDNAATDAATWMVRRYADPPPEIRQVPIEASTMPLATYRALLDADVSTALDITDLPEQATTASATVTIEGYTETILAGQHKLDFHTSRTETDSVWILDDPVYSVLDSTTRLAY